MNDDFKDMAREFIKVAVIGDMIEAQLIASILSDQNIPHRIRSYHDTALDGLYQAQKGWGELDAPAAYRDEITLIIQQIRSEAPPLNQ